MRTSLRKVGNSRGVIIPAAMLVACELGQEVELRVVGKSLVIEAVKTLRSQWFDGYQPEADADLLATLPADEDDAEWVW